MHNIFVKCKIEEQVPIGDEYTWASEGMAGLLSQDGVEVKEVTTDPDSGAGQAGESLFKDCLQANPPTHYPDTRHLSENLRKSIKRDDNKLLPIMAKRTKAEKTKLLANFALDVVDRRTAEINPRTTGR